MQLPASLSVAIWATASLWIVAVLAYCFGQPNEIIVGAVVVGCITAGVEALKLLG
jgi:hypothetical protein